eukprot:TRINITY_DN91922_c0_g1_i1.p1 TRINITY_DN91922_c0_g1~~TRINITY_DN91922_c0_g1_i1.p1  ORF type:complete len:425 (-),score=74.47 TRINITY_DN91922_c0_g1_i1:56-1330(-)
MPSHLQGRLGNACPRRQVRAGHVKASSSSGASGTSSKPTQQHKRPLPALVPPAACLKRVRSSCAQERAATAVAPAPQSALARAPQFGGAVPSRAHAGRVGASLVSSSQSSSGGSNRSASVEIMSPGPLLSESAFRRTFKPLSPLAGNPDRHQSEEDKDLHFGSHFRHLRRGEDRYSAYTADQPVVRSGMEVLRKDLVTRIIRAHLHCELKRPTLYLAIAILDEYLLSKRTALRPYPLAATALLVATKFEEELIPELETVATGLGNEALQPDEMVLSEAEFLHGINFHLHRPTPGHHLYWFVDMLVSEDMREEKVEKLSKMSHFICELGFLSACCAHWAPSLHAAAAALLAAALLKTTKRTRELENLIAPCEEGCPRKQLRTILKQLAVLVASEDLTREIVYRKYMTDENLNISFEAQRLVLNSD